MFITLNLWACSDSEPSTDGGGEEVVDKTTDCQSANEKGAYTTWYKPANGWVGDPIPYYDFKLLNRSFLVCSKGYIVFCRRCIRPEFCYLFCEIVENILRNLLYIRIIRICRYVFFFIIPVIRRHSDADSSSLFSLDTVKD